MNNKVLGQLLRLIVTVPSERLGALCNLCEKLASQRGGEEYENLLRFLRREPCWGKKKFLREITNVLGVATSYKLVADGTFADIFQSLGTQRRRWINEQEVVVFCHNHSEALRRGGYENFFEIVDNAVVQVTVCAAGKIEKCVFSFFREEVWHAEAMHSFVVPR
jgi:hypothetical protein